MAFALTVNFLVALITPAVHCQALPATGPACATGNEVVMKCNLPRLQLLDFNSLNPLPCMTKDCVNMLCPLRF